MDSNDNRQGYNIQSSGNMQKDKGLIHNLFALILLLWSVVCWIVLWSVIKAGYTNRHLEDCLMQANLAALIVDPYHYGSTGELVFEDADEIKGIFEEALKEGLEYLKSCE